MTQGKRRIERSGCYAVAVEFGNGVYAYAVDGDRVSRAPNDLFSDMVSKLPKSRRKQRCWRTRLDADGMKEPVVLGQP